MKKLSAVFSILFLLCVVFYSPKEVFAIVGDVQLDVSTGGQIIGSALMTNKFTDAANTDYYLDPAAATTSLTVAGSVGIGTTGPGTKLDVSGVITATGGTSTNWNTAYGWGNHAAGGYLQNSDYPSLNSIYSAIWNKYGFTSTDTATGNYVNYLSFGHGSVAGYAGQISIDYNTRGMYYRSVAGGSQQYAWTLLLDNASTVKSTGVLQIDGTGNSYIQGNVGIGTTGPLSTLSVGGVGVANTGVYGSGATNGVYGSGGSYGVNGVGVYGIYGTGTAGGGGVYGYGGGGSYGVVGNGSGYDFDARGAGVNYGATSSIRWKSDLQPIDNALDKVLSMRGLYFTWDEAHGGQRDMGMIAEEVGQYVPEIVGWDADAPGFATGMDYGHLTPVLVEAIKEQQTQIVSLKSITTDFISKFKEGLIETKKLIVDGVDILKKLTDLSMKVDTQQKQIEELRELIKAK